MNMLRTLSALALLAGTCGHTAAQSVYYPPLIGNTWATTDPEALGWCTDQLPALYDFLEESNSKAFIVLKDGRIVLEQYFGTFTADSAWYWASAAKSLTAFLVGLAQQQGHLDIDEPSSTYLGAGWTSCTPEQEAAITIRDQMAMTTGLDDTDGQFDCTDPECLTYLTDPGTRWSYYNAPYTLLDGVLEGATGQTLNSFVFSNLTTTTGITGQFVQAGFNNVFFSRARSMARFGLLAMSGGSWNGTPILTDTDYFNAMTTPSQALNPAYGYLWWLNGQSNYLLPGVDFLLPGPLMPDAPQDAYNAIGKNGQIINVSPNNGLVVVRMGNLPDGLFVPNVYNNEIWQHLNAVICLPTAVASQPRPNSLTIHPNPATDRITVSIAGAVPQRIRIIGADGRACLSVQRMGQVDTALLPPGTYMVEATGADGAVVRSKLVVAR
jgi:CubicO group peptidase (beta-lactamase class C family)